MATYRVFAEACAALTRHLHEAPRPAELVGHRLEFAVVTASEIARGLRDGAGVLPYRLRVAGGQPSPRGPGDPSAPPPLVAELQLLVVVAAEDADTRLALAGWVLRTLHDRPVLTGGDPVALAHDDMPRTELSRLWETQGLSGSDALPLPYVLTGLQIDSPPAGSNGEP